MILLMMVLIVASFAFGMLARWVCFRSSRLPVSLRTRVGVDCRLGPVPLVAVALSYPLAGWHVGIMLTAALGGFVLLFGILKLLHPEPRTGVDVRVHVNPLVEFAEHLIRVFRP